ncbi:MAG: DsbA family protein [Pseudomonadota bacterium]
MKKLRFLPIAGALLLVSAMSVNSAFAFDEAQKEEIGEIVREYLLANPELLIEVQEELEARLAEEEEVARVAMIQSASSELFESAADPVLGNPDGDVTVVEFFDYNCGFCRRAMDDMQAIIESDENVRFVLKEFPILGPDSIAAHQVAMAFNTLEPLQYGEFHTRLMDHEGSANEAVAVDIAVQMGVDESELRATMADPTLSNVVQRTYALAESLGIGGTPSYVIGDSLVPGALGVDELRARIAEARAAN